LVSVVSKGSKAFDMSVFETSATGTGGIKKFKDLLVAVEAAYRTFDTNKTLANFNAMTTAVKDLYESVNNKTIDGISKDIDSMGVDADKAKQKIVMEAIRNLFNDAIGVHDTDCDGGLTMVMDKGDKDPSTTALAYFLFGGTTELKGVQQEILKLAIPTTDKIKFTTSGKKMTGEIDVIHTGDSKNYDELSLTGSLAGIKGKSVRLPFKEIKACASTAPYKIETMKGVSGASLQAGDTLYSNAADTPELHILLNFVGLNSTTKCGKLIGGKLNKWGKLE
jgi:hypothetical protein